MAADLDDELTEILLVPVNRVGCFLCEPSVDRMLAYMRDGTWKFCVPHMREIAAAGDQLDDMSVEPIHLVPR